MTRRPVEPAPTWAVVLVMLGLGVVLRAILPHDTPELPPVSMAFFGWLSILASAIIAGLHEIADLGLFLLYQMLRGAWAGINIVRDGLIEFGRGFLHLGRSAWGFLRGLYEDVLKPGWLHFWHWVDEAKGWLTNFFKPVFEFLKSIREELLKFYDHWIRPIMDTIDAVRHILGVFNSLGLEWAGKLDAELARIEEKINAPFQFVLRKINDVINIIDQVVTAGGLFQRLALVRSIERDLGFINASWVRAGLKDISADEVERQRALKYAGADPAEPGKELRKLYADHTGKYAGIVSELVPMWRISAGLQQGEFPP